MTTELNVESGMHIEADPKTGAIAASQVLEEAPKGKEPDEQPEQTQKAEAEQPEPQVNPRQAIMDTIYAKRADSFQKELDYAAAISMGATVDPIKEEQTVEPERKTEAAKTEEQQAPAAEPKPKETKQYTINGQNVNLNEAELQQLLNRFQAERQQYVQPQQPVHQPVQQQQRSVEQEPQDKDRLKEIARKITYGNEEESTNALQDLVGLTIRNVQRPTGPTPDQIVQVATNNAVAQLQFQQNLNTIANEYADVFNKRSLTLVAADNVNSLRNKYSMLGVPKPDIELYREACELTRQELVKPSETVKPNVESKPAAQPAQLQAKLERKRAAPQPPAGANKIASELPSNAHPSGSQVVAAMRKSRGQSAMT